MTLVIGPSTPVSPSGIVTFQVRLSPTVTFISDGGKEEDKWMALPHHLVFAVPPKILELPPYGVKRRKALREEDVMLATTNMRGVTADKIGQLEASLKDDDAKYNPRLRCVGVCLDRLIYSETLVNNPSTHTRFSVMTSGMVTIACDSADIREANYGDVLYWLPVQSAVAFYGSEGHRTVRLGWTRPGRMDDEEERTASILRLKELFGPADTGLTITEDIFFRIVRPYKLGTIYGLGHVNQNECRLLLRLYDS